MSTASNRFYVTALQDGSTLHGNLSTVGSISQSWNGTSAYPDWTVAANQPIIYVTLLNGAAYVVPDNTGKWYYNDHGTEEEITVSDTRFQITTFSLNIGNNQSITVPALKIVQNLASTTNVDVDTITYRGSYTIGGSPIGFAVSTQIRITSASKGSSIGVVNFVNGISNITSVGQTITMYAACYGADDGSDVSGYTTTWYLNDTEIQSGDSRLTTYTVGAKTYPAFVVSESDVVDHAIVRCMFYKNGELLDTVYVEVDDMQDPEFLYILNNGNVGNGASLRKGDSAPFVVFVGTNDSATVRSGWENATYKLQLIDASKQVITASSLNDVPNPDSGDPDYYRTLQKYPNNYQDENLRNKAHFSINYSIPEAYGMNITGYIVATV